VSSGDTVSVVCHATPSLRRQWFGELARLLASARPPAAVLFEGSFDHPHPRVTVRPKALVRVLVRSLAGSSVRVEEQPGVAPAPPVSLGCERMGCVVRVGGSRGRPPEETRTGIDRVGIAPAVPPGTWLGLQTFWLPAPHGTLWIARRFRIAAGSRSDLDARFPVLGTAVAAEWGRAIGLPATFRAAALGHRRDWRRGGLRSVPPEGWFERPPEFAARSAVTPEQAGRDPADGWVETPAIVLGASGAGKTTYLARWAARTVRAGGSVVAIDLHGDLTPAIVGRLTPEDRRRSVVVDATLPPVPGVAALCSE